MRQCEILVNKVLAAMLTETDEGTYVFVYDNDYLTNPKSLPISATMPLRKQEYKSDYLFPVFFNMLSEGANREYQSKALHLDINDDFK